MLAAGFGLATVVEGLVFATLGFIVARWRSAIALGLAVVLFAADGIAAVVLADPGSHPSPGPLVVRLFLLVPMVRGFGAIRDIKRAASVAPGKLPE
jgi:hypothetical protein